MEAKLGLVDPFLCPQFMACVWTLLPQQHHKNLVLFSGDFGRAQETNKFFFCIAVPTLKQDVSPAMNLLHFKKRSCLGIWKHLGGEVDWLFGGCFEWWVEWIWLLLEILKMELAVLGLFLLVSFWLKNGL